MSIRCGLPLAFVLIGVGLSQAQSNRPAASSADAVLRQIRTVLGHGVVDDARSIASAPALPAPSRELGLALVDVFRGADDEARKRLQALLAGPGDTREAALELALLELRHGQRDDAKRHLQPLLDESRLRTVDDYFLFARAARANGELFLANSAYQRIAALGAGGRADIFAERGDLWLQGHLNGEAVTDYKNALTADPKWVPAHLGISRAFSDEDPGVANEEFEAARTIAPDHPDVWLLAADRALAADDFAAAKTALDKVDQVRPGSLKAAGLRGAIAYGERRSADIDAAIARVHEIDPTSGYGYRAAGQEAARKYRFQDAADYARKAVEIDAQDSAAQGELGLYLLRTGDEPAARTALERAWAGDKGDVVTKNLLDMLDRLDDFAVVPDGDLIYKFPKDEAAVLKVYALPLGREAYNRYVEQYGFKPQGPILIEVFAKHDDFAVRTVALPGMVGALGACFGRVVTMDSPKARPPGDFSWQATLWHEMAHVFTLQLSEYRVPRWLTEGLSVFEEHRKSDPWGRELTVEFARNLAKGHIFGVKGMSTAFKHPESLSLAYFEASLVVEHLVDTGGYPAIRTLLRAYADGATDSDAFAKAYGKSVDEFEASYTAFVKQRYGQLGAALADPSPQVDAKDVAGLKVRAASHQENFFSQWAYGRALFDAGDYAAARPVLERAAALAPQVRGTVSPHGLLAQIAEKEGDLTRARKELRDLLAVDHENVEAARHLATLAAKANATDDQDMALRLVADLDPFDSEVHTLLGRREAAKGRHAAALIEFQAALALGPANAAETHTDAGEALLALGRKDEARKEALAALQQAPTYGRAQELLLAVAAK